MTTPTQALLAREINFALDSRKQDIKLQMAGDKTTMAVMIALALGCYWQGPAQA
jgi:hypothetical protein